jgi:hypothetical protein
MLSKISSCDEFVLLLPFILDETRADERCKICERRRPTPSTRYVEDTVCEGLQALLYCLEFPARLVSTAA